VYAISQTVTSFWSHHSWDRFILPTMAAWAWLLVRSCGICDGQRDAETNCLWVLQFHPSILIQLTAWHSSSSGAGTTVADIPRNQSHPTQINKKENNIITSFSMWQSCRIYDGQCGTALQFSLSTSLSLSILILSMFINDSISNVFLILTAAKW
jgi:hypothetical protein